MTPPLSPADLARLFDARLAEPVRHVLEHHNPRYSLRQIVNFAVAEAVRSLLEELAAEHPTDATLPPLIARCDAVSHAYQKVSP